MRLNKKLLWTILLLAIVGGVGYVVYKKKKSNGELIDNVLFCRNLQKDTSCSSGLRCGDTGNCLPSPSVPLQPTSGTYYPGPPSGFCRYKPDSSCPSGFRCSNTGLCFDSQ